MDDYGEKYEFMKSIIDDYVGDVSVVDFYDNFPDMKRDRNIFNYVFMTEKKVPFLSIQKSYIGGMYYLHITFSPKLDLDLVFINYGYVIKFIFDYTMEMTGKFNLSDVYDKVKEENISIAEMNS